MKNFKLVRNTLICVPLLFTATVFAQNGTDPTDPPIIIDPPPPPPVINTPPVVRLVYPQTNVIFLAPANIGLVAEAVDKDGYVTQVEFFEGRNSLGVVTNLPTMPPYPQNSGAFIAPRFTLMWTNVAAGTYVLTAAATDNQGATTVSPPVQITVRPPEVPRTVVTIKATDGEASEPGANTAAFTVTRSGLTNDALEVFYQVSGSASNGVDYDLLKGQLTIPAGEKSARLLVTPIDDNIAEPKETVIVAIRAPACPAIYPPPPSCYLVGSPNSAIAYLLDNDTVATNIPPMVSLLSPPNGARYLAPATIRLEARTQDQDGYASTVKFYANNQFIGESSLQFIQPPPPGQPLFLGMVWSNVVAGEYILTAKAIDDRGAETISAAVKVAVVTNAPPPPPPPPPTNLPPLTIVAVDSIAAEGTNSLGQTNVAVFKIRRTGDTNADLTVEYAISGTASNGVDYLPLPTAVTIPAGQRVAEIVVVPIDDTNREPAETVILTLKLTNALPVEPVPLDPTTTGTVPSAGANSLESRLYPYPYPWLIRAAAIINDNDRPLPPIRQLPDGSFNVIVPKTNYTGCVRVEVSTNLVEWVIVGTNNVSSGAAHYVDPAGATGVKRFYRLTPVPCAPAE